MNYFDHEKLEVYKRSLDFVEWVSEFQKEIVKRYNVSDQLERASDSIPLNIAEGNGKFTSKDRCKYFDIARASALESSSCLDVFVAKGIVNSSRIVEGKQTLLEIVKMIVGLIKSNSNRAFEQDIDYKTTD